MREFGRLAATKVAALKKPGRYGDGNGLYLQVSQWQTKSWLLRYQLAGRSREMGLGSLTDVSLKEARDKARVARSMLIDGDDPIDARDAKKQALRAESAKRITFKEAAGKYIAAHRAGWRNGKHAAQWTSTLTTYAYPVIGNLGVADIGTGHIVKILEAIWSTKTDTAARLRGRIENILDWATARHFRDGDNPARWKGHVESLLPAKSKVRQVRHQPAMPFEEVPAFVGELRLRDGISARALEFTILTAARTSEAINAAWTEIDLNAGIWTVPAERMKAGREHRVPLSVRATAILSAMPREKGSPFVFPGGKARKPLSNMAMLELVRGMREGDLTVHGFRSSFRDWAGEATNYPRELAEAALGHVIGDAAEQAYRRGDALEKRRKLMEAWARHCASPAKGKADNVTPIRKAR
ncbi:MAG TPA: integrase arm-type DNA-binding domain-containing protein [Rhizomicrobium sp.]|nr:integrase arm-type DNA-binding domain-containing protein [Rhizomicrobium sp.]